MLGLLEIGINEMRVMKIYFVDFIGLHLPEQNKICVNLIHL